MAPNKTHQTNTQIYLESISKANLTNTRYTNEASYKHVSELGPFWYILLGQGLVVYMSTLL